VSTQGLSFLAIGHVTTDLVGGEEVLGGAALYASVQARALGLAPRVLTAAHRDWSGRKFLRTFSAKQIFSEATTTFAYEPGAGPRRARVTAVADPLTPSDLPEGWAASDVALLCPVLGEIDPGFAEVLRPRILGVAPQGWMRRTGEDRAVVSGPWESAERILARAHAVFFSEADAPDADLLAERYAERAPVVVVTRGERGATLFAASGRMEVPPFPAREIDSTGAGDVFAAAYLVACAEGAAPRDAAELAAAAAACAVEAPGIAGIRGRAIIQARKRS
jgi:sugar/nucleoside kinase (ribokinase family)